MISIRFFLNNRIDLLMMMKMKYYCVCGEKFLMTCSNPNCHVRLSLLISKCNSIIFKNKFHAVAKRRSVIIHYRDARPHSSIIILTLLLLLTICSDLCNIIQLKLKKNLSLIFRICASF